MYFEYRIVKIEKGLFLIEYKTAPYGVWHEVKNKQFKTKPKAEAWARKNLIKKSNRMKQKLKMIWRIIRDRQVVVITEDHGKMYYNWDTRSLEDTITMCNAVSLMAKGGKQ